MIRKLRQIFGNTPPRMLDQARHEGNVYIIGDIHGSFNLLKGLERKIFADGGNHGRESLLICIGDMIDRGPDSFAVLEHMMQPPPYGFQRVCLMGNHEEMMLNFLDSPAKANAWLEFGGYETLASYGLFDSEIRLAQGNARKMKLLLARAIPQKHQAFLRSLPHIIKLNNFIISHAGGNSAKPFDQQSVQDLLWGADNFFKAVPLGDKTIIHGHYIVERPQHSGGKVAIDTGAFATGVLTAAKIGPDQSVEFMSFSEPESGIN